MNEIGITTKKEDDMPEGGDSEYDLSLHFDPSELNDSDDYCFEGGQSVLMKKMQIKPEDLEPYF